MANHQATMSQVDRHRNFFRNLDDNFVRPERTPTQEKREADERAGRKIWEEVLAQQRKKHPAASETVSNPKSSPPQICRFLGLLAELRNMVYQIYQDDIGNPLQGRRSIKYDEDEVLRNGIEESERAVIRGTYAGVLERTEDAREAYTDYKAAYKVSFIRVDISANHEYDGILISARGNLREDIPFLPITNRQVLGVMWEMRRMSKFDKRSRPWPNYKDIKLGPRYEATVLNFDIFPLFRFLHMVCRLPGGPRMMGAEVDIALIDDPEQTTAGSKYRKISKLITKHWMDNVPLWSCMTKRDQDAPGFVWWRGKRQAKFILRRWLYRVR